MNKKIFALIALTLALLVPVLSVSAQDTGCNRPRTPVVDRITEVYGVAFEEYAEWYCQGITLTAIAQAMYIAELTVENDTYGDWLALLADPTSYRAALAELGYSLADISPAAALFRR